MFYVYTQSVPAQPAGAGMGVMGRIFAWATWAIFAMLGLMFLFVLLFWLGVAAAFSLLAGLITGRPSTVGTLWRQYRAMAQRRWPQRPDRAAQRASATPRADAASGPASAAAQSGVQDVAWRDLPPAGQRR